MSSCCLQGNVHEGTPTGTFETLTGLQTYIVEAKNGTSGKVVIIWTDVFGPYLNNVKLFADEWARNGYTVYVPDIFQGDALSTDLLYDLKPRDYDPRKGQGIVASAIELAKMAQITPWLFKHRESVTKPVVDKFLQYIREEIKPTKLVSIGFCFGGRYALLTGRESEPHRVDICIAYHPSLVSVPTDLLGLRAPTYLGVGTYDYLVPPSKLPAFESALQDQLGKDNIKVTSFQDMIHGFVMRGNSGREEERAAMETATREGIDWANKWTA